MATNLNYKQVANVVRRSWDKEAYEQRAKERQAREDDEGLGKTSDPSSAIDDGDSSKEEFQAASHGAVGPEGSKRAYLKARQGAVDLESKVGKSEMVSAENAVVKSGIGWHCKVCDCFLKDSHTYLDHINGRKHQRKLGYTMRAERSTKEQVLDRLKEVAKDVQQKGNGVDALVDYDKLIQEKDKAWEKEREEKRRKRKEKKDLKNQPVPEDEDGEVEEEAEEIEPDVAAMMGFSGFGGSGKKG